MVNAGDRISPLKSLLILATYLFAFTGLAQSQMGISFDKCACKDEFENVKEFKEMGETFTSAELNDKKNGLKTIYTFYNGKLVRVKFSRSDGREWSEDLARRLWEKWFNEDAICSRRESFDKDQKEDWLIIFNGKDRNQMVLGRGKYKSSLLLESSTMTTLKSKYVKTQIGKNNKTVADDDQYQPLIPLPWQKRVTKEEYMKRRASDELEDDEQSIYSKRGGYGGVINQNGSMSDSTGAYSGFVAPGGAMYDKNGRYAGQVSPGGAMSDSTGRYNGSVNRGTIINNP
jgi:hypothetical protein